LGKITIKLVMLAVLSFLASTGLTHAQEAVPDKFRLSIGTYALTRYESTVSLTDPDLGAGASISPQRTLGVDVENSVLRIEGHYRFRPRHALTFAWFSINSDGDKTIDEEFDWLDEDGDTITIPVGARVVSSLSYDILKVGYLWSFHRTDKVEMGVGAGLHITRLSFDLDASVTTPPSQSVQDTQTTLPLPVISLIIKYNVTPKFHWYAKSEVFALRFDNYSGTFSDVTLGMEYRAWRHVALGVGFTTSSLDIEEEDSEYLLRFDNTISGGLLYVATYF
jgi:hypothetical protein